MPLLLRLGFGLHLLVLIAFIAMIGESRAAQLTAPGSWQSKHFQDHVLVGTVWRGSGEPVGWQALNEAVSQAALILVGEIHPNPDHHHFQAQVLSALAARGRQPSIVWEMVPAARQSVLDDWLTSKSPNVDMLGQALDWSNSGWPAWTIYQPIAQVAAREQLRMIGSALPRETMMSIGRRGADGVDQAMRTQLHLSIELPPQARTALLQRLRDGHCGLMPETALAAMSVAQRARDGAMATAMLGTDPDADAVLIAGNGHIRQDWGVGGLLARLAPSVQTLAIAQIEVQADHSDPMKYFADHDTANGYDFVIFTPRAEIKDYCAELRKRFGDAKPKL